MSDPGIHVVLFEPEIPQNTGNIARTCACTGATLHLVEPMGFRATQRNLARAGLDYWDKVVIERHSCTRDFLENHRDGTLVFFTGHTNRNFFDLDLASCALDRPLYLVFGRESWGIDPEILEAHEAECVRIPMLDSLRSLNLSNAVAIAVYETLRQMGFGNLA
ncbi:MAG: tRNA (cytidine(34)-2'-O)-methyltransferase [Coriobacteriia bacterium]|nr:tRNA (cytidine(34)-2'-O)-methyltransferase [Coriobacteriia bacterium]